MNYIEQYEKELWWKSAVLSLGYIFRGIFIAFILKKVIAALVPTWKIETIFESPTSAILMEIATIVIFLAVAILLFKKQFACSISNLIHENKQSLKRNFSYLYFYGLISFGANFILSGIIGTVLVNENDVALNEMSNSVPVVLYILFVGILAPAIEEIVFRFSLFRLINLWNGRAAHIVCAILFGLFHVWDYLVFDHAWVQLLTMLPYCVGGFCFTMLYEKTKNICYPIFLHILNNGISISLTMIFL